MYKNNNVSTAWFLLATFCISYGLWGLCILGQRVFEFSGNVWFMPFYFVGGNAPAIAAFFAIKRVDSGYTFKEFMKSTFTFRQSLLSYGLVILMIAINFGVPALMDGIVEGAAPGVEGMMGVGGHIPLYITLLGIPLFFFAGGSEELGWRGILQPKLEKKMHYIPATILVGIIWTIWHLPLWLISGTGQTEMNFWLFFISVMGLSFALAAIRRISGSVWLCVLLHCATNSLEGTWPTMDTLPIRLVTFALHVCVAILAIHLHEKRLLAKSK